MNNDFCKALAAKDSKSLQKVVDGFLDGLNAKGNEQANFDSIKTWIESQECVESVEIGRGMLRSDPPIKEFFVKLKEQKTADTTVTIGIRFHPDKLKFYSN